MAPSGTALDLILHQLGDLFLRSVPTVVLFLLLQAAYRLLVHAPLLKVLAARRERTTGAVERAQAAIQTADARSQEYEAKLRAARTRLEAEAAQTRATLESRADQLAAEILRAIMPSASSFAGSAR